MRIETARLATGKPWREQLGERIELHRGDLTAHLALVLVVAAYFWPMLRPFGGHWYIAAGDFSRQFYPFRWFEAHEWWHLRLPLWSPDMFAGHPFQADVQTAVFYPLAMADAILLGHRGLPYAALELEVVVHTLLAGVFTYWLARRLTGSRLGGLAAGVAFALGGFITTYPAEQLPMLETAVWLPLIILFLELTASATRPTSIPDKVAKFPPGIEGVSPAHGFPEADEAPGMPLVSVRRTAPAVDWRWLVGAGVAFGISILAGHPQTVLFIAYATEGYLIWRLWRSRVSWSRLVGAAALYPIVALGVSAVQILPSLEFLRYSTRDQMGYAEAASGYLPSALWEIFVPLWHGEKALSIGIAGLALALIGAWASRREPLAYWTVAGLIAIPLSVGGATPLFWVLYHVAPGWDLFRDQERTIYVFSFAASLLAGRGVAELQRHDLKRAIVQGWSLAAGLGSLAFLALFALAPAWRAPPSLRLNFGLDAVVLALVASFLVVRSIAAGDSLSGTTSAAKPDHRPGLSISGSPRLMPVVGVAFVVLVAAELFVINDGNNLSPNSPVPVPRFEKTAAFIQKFPEPFRVRGISEEVFPSDYGTVLGLPTIGGDTPFQLRRMRDMLAADADWRVWQILNVKFFISNGGPLAGLKLVFQDGDLKTYFMTDSLPRAWAVRAVEVAQSPDEARKLILAPAYHPGNVVVLEQPTSIGPFAPGPRPDVRITHLDPQRIEIDANAGANAMLVLAQQYYPDWVAYRDGQPVTTFRANYLAMAFELPPGNHHYVIVYRPSSCYLGALVSLATVAAALAFVAWPWLGWQGKRR